jgi:hypothetical protein
MKKSILFILALSMISGLFALKTAPPAKIEVYYFHFTRRCTTCQNLVSSPGEKG